MLTSCPSSVMLIVILTLGLFVGPLTVTPQLPGKVPRIGFLWIGLLLYLLSDLLRERLPVPGRPCPKGEGTDSGDHGPILARAAPNVRRIRPLHTRDRALARFRTSRGTVARRSRGTPGRARGARSASGIGGVQFLCDASEIPRTS